VVARSRGVPATMVRWSVEIMISSMDVCLCVGKGNGYFVV
jgi:hypothetical protein